MNSLIGFVDKFLTIQAICGYVVGVFTGMAILWIMDKREHTNRVHSMRLMAILWALIILFTGYVSIGIERNTTCIIEVLATLSTRAQLSDAADDQGDKRDAAATEWLTVKDYPPPEIAKLRWEDPRRQNWIHARDAEYLGKIHTAQMERRKVLNDKAAHQVPESRCGKN